VARKSYLASNRDLAYRIWRECGQNVDLTCRKLRQLPEGFPVTRQTLGEWLKVYNWRERAARAEAEEQRTKDAVVGAEEKVLSTLARVINKLDQQIDTSEGALVDSQMLFAFRNVAKTFMEIKAAADKAAGKTPTGVSIGEPQAITVTVTRPKTMPAQKEI
jgi:hypothetical protein